MKIWIVTASSGNSHDYAKWNLKGFLSEDCAKWFIATQGKIDYIALQELDQLKWQYIGVLDMTGHDCWTDEQWDAYQAMRYAAEDKATKEIQTKYPNADLTADLEFNGYDIECLEVEE